MTKEKKIAPKSEKKEKGLKTRIIEVTLLMVRKTPKFPKTLEEADDWLGEMGAVQQSLLGIAVRIAAAVKKIKDEVAERVQEAEDLVAARFNGIAAFADKNREEILDEGKKSVVLANGEIGWRFTGESIQVDEEKATIKYMEENGLKDLLRYPPAELDKVKMKQERDRLKGVPGVRIVQDEIFFVKPRNGTEELAMKLVAVNTRLTQAMQGTAESGDEKPAT